jgi:predicted metal-dependent HD superfamily phosphohydrolase/AcrR family transcriptional regulator
MGRPSNREQRRTELVQALLRVIAKDGWSACTMEAIAREAGVSTGLVNYHFTTKHDLLVAMVGQLDAQLRGRAERRVSPDGDPWVALDAVLGACLGLGADADPVALAAWSALGSEAARVPDVALRYANALAGLRASLDEALRACVPGASMEFLSVALLTAIEGAWRIGTIAPALLPEGRMADVLRRTAYDGLRSASREVLATTMQRVAPFDVSSGLASVVEAAWSADGRWYHDPLHLVHVLEEWKRIGRAWKAPTETFVAFLFHDAIYVGGRGDNEALSAELARAVVPAFVARCDLERVVDLVVRTAHHDSPERVDEDTALFLDVDLAILGASPAIYDRYAAGVVREHAEIPRDLFLAGRVAFLDRMLALPRVYRTDRFHRKLERRARENLTRERSRLSSR